MRRRINVDSSKEYNKGVLGKRSCNSKLPIGNPGFAVKKNITSTIRKGASAPTSTSSVSLSFTSATATSSTTPLVGDASTDDTQTGHSADANVFLIIGLIIGVTLVGCVLACLFRRRRIRREMISKSIRSTSVGSGKIARKHLEIDESKQSPIAEGFPRDPRTMNEEIDNIRGMFDTQEVASFSKMKLPPTTALPQPPMEAHHSYTTPYRSEPPPNVNTDGSAQITNPERTKYMGRNMKKSPKFNFPPPPGRPPNYSTLPRSTSVNPATQGSELLTFTPTTSILNDHNSSYAVSPPKWFDDANDHSPSQNPLSMTPRRSSEIFATSWPKPPQISITCENGDHNNDIFAGDVGLTPLPKVEKINKNLSINFDQLSIFKDKTTRTKEYPVDAVGVEERSGFKNHGTSQVMTVKDGDKNVEILVINDNSTEKLYNEYI